MTFLPVANRELNVLARKRGTYLLRIIFAALAVGLAFVVMSLSGFFQARASGLGGGLFLFIAVTGFLFCSIAGVFLTSDSLSAEKRQGTLGFLFLTDLRGYDVVLGKLLATSLSAFYGLFAIFPVLAITLTLGGVTPGEFWRMVLVFINTLFFSLAAGMFVSSISRWDNRAMGGTFFVLVLVIAVLPSTQFTLGILKLVGPHSISLPSPFTAWTLAFDGAYRQGADAYWNSLGITLLLSWLMLLLASLLLPRIWQERQGMAWVVPNRVSADQTDSPRRMAQRTEMLDVNPVFWLAGRGYGVAGGIAFAFASVVMVGWCLSHSNSLLRDVGAGLAGTLFPVSLRILIALTACRFFLDLRRGGALELLLTTPLTVKQILAGHWLALRRKFLFPVLAVVGLQLVVVLLLFTGAVPQVPLFGWFGPWGLLFGAPSFIPDVFAAAWIGMLVGLTAKKSAKAPALALLYVIGLPTALVCVPNLFIDIPLIFWARDKLHRELRQLGSARYEMEALQAAPSAKPAPPRLW